MIIKVVVRDPLHTSCGIGWIPVNFFSWSNMTIIVSALFLLNSMLILLLRSRNSPYIYATNVALRTCLIWITLHSIFVRVSGASQSTALSISISTNKLLAWIKEQTYSFHLSSAFGIPQPLAHFHEVSDQNDDAIQGIYYCPASSNEMWLCEWSRTKV